MTLTERYAVKYNKNKKEAAVDVAMMIGVLQDALHEDGEVKINNFGTLKVVSRAARRQRNPRTGEEITCPAYKTVKFNVYREFKNTLN